MVNTFTRPVTLRTLKVWGRRPRNLRSPPWRRARSRDLTSAPSPDASMNPVSVRSITTSASPSFTRSMTHSSRRGDVARSTSPLTRTTAASCSWTTTVSKSPGTGLSPRLRSDVHPSLDGFTHHHDRRLALRPLLQTRDELPSQMSSPPNRRPRISGEAVPKRHITASDPGDVHRVTFGAIPGGFGLEPSVAETALVPAVKCGLVDAQPGGKDQLFGLPPACWLTQASTFARLDYGMAAGPGLGGLPRWTPPIPSKNCGLPPATTA